MSKAEVRARDIFTCYPDSDLIALREPMPNETISTYLHWIAEANQPCGDTLFQFILQELSGCDRTRSIELLETAIHDLQAVKKGLESASRDAE